MIGRILAEAAGSTNGFAFVGADNGSISHVVVTPDRWIIRCFNDTSHLAPRCRDRPRAADVGAAGGCPVACSARGVPGPRRAARRTTPSGCDAQSVKAAAIASRSAREQ